MNNILWYDVNGDIYYQRSHETYILVHMFTPASTFKAHFGDKAMRLTIPYKIVSACRVTCSRTILFIKTEKTNSEEEKRKPRCASASGKCCSFSWRPLKRQQVSHHLEECMNMQNYCILSTLINGTFITTWR